MFEGVSSEGRDAVVSRGVNGVCEYRFLNNMKVTVYDDGNDSIKRGKWYRR